MKKRVIVKLLTSLISSIIMAIGCALIFFGYEDFWSISLFCSVIFVIIYSVIGVPVSILIDMYFSRIKMISKFKRTLLLAFLYVFSGVVSTIIFYAISRRERYSRLFEKEMIMFYEIGIVGSLLFLIVERVIRRIR
ncbi:MULTISPECIES: hypothetical protein [Paenibacillus]|uniref:hypothetical protein n=1 Tax=Paenibacillus TaxID=44249 RepID=UPI00036621C2|nr:hypothetical protein [Paenibacillus terrigena]